VLHSAENARLLYTQALILDKLEDGPHDVRDLCRKFHRLRNAPCIEALYQLKDSGEVVRVDNKWMLTESPKALTLEV
jgi:hypothetical protein